MNKCKYCGSENLYLENKSNKNIMELPQVALKCADCGKWLKWCPKEERHQYIKTKTNNEDHKIKILESALEIAVRTMEIPSGYCADKECPQIACRPCLIKQFIAQAQKELK